MYDSFAQSATDARLADRVLNPWSPEPGWFDGLGDALQKAPGATFFSSMRALSPVLDAYGKAAAFSNAPAHALLTGKDAPDMGALKDATIDKIGQNDFGREIREIQKDFTPDPMTTGGASQFVFNAAKMLGKAGGYFMLGGLPGAAIGTGLDEASVHTQELMDQGVDLGTATKAGLVHGAITGASIALPVAGRTLPETVGLVAVGGPGGFMAEQAAIKAVLENADYADVAEQYDPFDPAGLTLSTLLPAFGAAASRFGKSRAPKVSSDDVAAAYQLQAAQQINTSALASPANLDGMTKHVEAVNQVARQLDEGEPVSIAEPMQLDPEVAAGIAKRAQDAPTLENPPPDLPLFSEPSIVDAKAATSSELAAAAARLGDELVPLGSESIGGVHARKRASEVAGEIESIRKQTSEARAYQAAVDCFLRVGI